MEKYIVILQGKVKGTLTSDLLHSHIEHLHNLQDKNILFLCGPFKDNDGGVQILKANSYKEAESYVLQDPFIAQKYYASYIIHELIEANESNNYLLDNSQTKTNLER
ncbi:MAG: YciI family protein [Defluviitaleaceae bacterium]|nr:YciI family protein [Defluviitaleaceae bacterium]